MDPNDKHCESPCPTVFCVKALCLIQQRNEPARGGTNDVDGSRFQTFGTLFDGFSTINTHPKIKNKKGAVGNCSKD